MREITYFKVDKVQKVEEASKTGKYENDGAT